MSATRKGLLVVHRPKGSTDPKQHEIYFISHEDLAQFKVQGKNEHQVAQLLAPYSSSKPHAFVLHGAFMNQPVAGTSCCKLKLNKIKEVLGISE